MFVCIKSIVSTDKGDLIVLDTVFVDNREFAFCVGGKTNYIYEIFDNGTSLPKLRLVSEPEFEQIFKIFLANYRL